MKDRIKEYENKIKEIDEILEKNFESYIEKIEKKIDTSNTPNIAEKVIKKINTKEAKVIEFKKEEKEERVFTRSSIYAYMRIACFTVLVVGIALNFSPQIATIKNQSKSKVQTRIMDSEKYIKEKINKQDRINDLTIKLKETIVKEK